MPYGLPSDQKDDRGKSETALLNDVFDGFRSFAVWT